MTRSEQPPLSVTMSGLALVILAATSLVVFAAIPGATQTFQVLYNFTGGRDGSGPLDGVSLDRNGNLYGTASAGGRQVTGCSNYESQPGCGTVFELAHSGSGWILKPLYEFQGGTDAYPTSGVVFGPDGALYGLNAGTSASCNNGYGCGGVYRLTPPPSICPTLSCSWQETVLHQFPGQPDGSSPDSRPVFDFAGNLYGVTFFGGLNNVGAAYELTPGNGSWTESVIYSFNQNVGVGSYWPNGPLVLDQSGNLYGTAYCNEIQGCYSTVWQLQHSGPGWAFNNIFNSDGRNGYEFDGVISDASGNLYGLSDGDQQNNGSENAYKLTPSNGEWTWSSLANLGEEGNLSGPAMDSAGNLYGSNIISGFGTLFKLTRSGNTYTYSVLHTFNSNDGEFPIGTLIVDSSGTLYGTTVKGGTFGYGVIWEITP